MGLKIYPLNLGDLDTDRSFVVWQMEPGTTRFIPTTAWLITGGESPTVVDAGFRSAAELQANFGNTVRQTEEQTLVGQLAKHGVAPEDVRNVIMTHLHIDHTGQIDHLPNARIHIQREELRYAAAPTFPVALYDRTDIAKLIGPLWGRVRLLTGDDEVLPGIRAKITGGHTPAHQILYVELDSGTAVICGDAAYEVDINVAAQVPSGYVVNMQDAVDALELLSRETGPVLASHDASVYERYPNGID